MTKSKNLKRDIELALSVIREEEKANELSENENNYSDDESDDVSTISRNNYQENESPLPSSCNLQDEIEKFKKLIHDFDDFYDNDWKDKMDSLYKKLDNSTLSKKEKIKIMLCGAYLENYGDILGEAPGRELKKIFSPEDIEYEKEIDTHLDSNQHLDLGLKELEKIEKNDNNGIKIFDASNYDHKLVYILHNVIL